MQRFRFKPGLTINIEGKELKLLRLIDKIWQVENTSNGVINTISVGELINHYTSGKILIVGANQTLPIIKLDGKKTLATFDALQPHEQEILKSKRHFLEEYLQNHGDNRSLNNIHNAINEYWTKSCPSLPKPSKSSAYRILKNYIASEKNILSLLGNRHLRGNKSRRIDPTVEELCTEAIREIYLKLVRGTKKATLSKARLLTYEENRLRPVEHHLPMPSMSTIKQLIAKLPPQEVYAARYGVTATRHKFRNSIYSVLLEHALQRVLSLITQN